MNNNQYSNLKIAGNTEFTHDIRMMIRDDMEELVSIVNKGIDSISYDEKKVIKNRWLSIKYEKKSIIKLFTIY